MLKCEIQPEMNACTSLELDSKCCFQQRIHATKILGPLLLLLKHQQRQLLNLVQWGHSETSGGTGDEYKCLHQSLDPEQDDTALPVPVLS